MKGIPKLLLSLLIETFLFCAGASNARAFATITFGEEGALIKIDFRAVTVYGGTRIPGPDRLRTRPCSQEKQNFVLGSWKQRVRFPGADECKGEQCGYPGGDRASPERIAALDAYFMADY